MSRFALALSAPLVLVACGPSMKNVVESDMRFEHCYRIDEDPSTPLANKRACWREWTAHYVKGQDRLRVSYARDRVKVLDGAIASTTSTPPPVASVAPSACPPPGNPYSPPPSVVPKEEKSAATPTAAACSDACATAWKTCSSPCGSASNCVLECDTKFRTCVKACL